MTDDDKSEQLPDLPRPHHNGWSKPKMRQFLEALAGSGSVTAAAKAVHMSRDSAYKLRARLAGTPFDLAWEGALENGIRQVAHEAIDRAINGVVQPVYYKGEQVGERRVFNENLTRLILDNPSRFGRQPLAREHALLNWDAMLDRVEKGALDWNVTDEAMQDDPEMDEAITKHLESNSEYARGWIWEIASTERKTR